MEDILLTEYARNRRHWDYPERDNYQSFYEMEQQDSMRYNRRRHYDEGMSEKDAVSIVQNMHHTYNGKTSYGEHFTMDKARNVFEKYRSVLPNQVSPKEIYIALNAQYHDYCKLFKNWFDGDIDSKIITSALVFWFLDEDNPFQEKFYRYF